MFFADSLSLIKTLVKGGNALLNPDKKPCKSNIPTVYKAVFQEEFNAHDALEDVRALHRVLFQSPLQVTVADIVNNSNMKSTFFAFEDMEFLDGRQEHMQTFKDKLFHRNSENYRKLQKAAFVTIIYEIFTTTVERKH